MKKCYECGGNHNKRGNYCKKIVIKHCLICGKEMNLECNSRMKSLCSRKCTSINANIVKKEKEKEEQECKMCGNMFLVKGKTKDGILGCSPTCRFQMRNGPRNCDNCGKEYFPKSKDSNSCSFKCSGMLAQSHSAKKKRIRTNIDKYGVENVFCNEEIKNKIKSTMVEKYGVENPMQNKKINEKAMKTVSEKYGVKSPIQNSEIMSKLKRTNLERYGNTFSLANKEVKNKKEKTMIEKYGTKEPFKSKEIVEKIKKTNLKRYGNENPFGSELIKQKIKKINLERYGAENYSNRKTLVKELRIRDEKVLELYKEGYTEYDIADILDFEYITIRRVLLKNNVITPANISKINKYWAHKIKNELGVNFEYEGKIFSDKRQSVDLYNDEHKIAIDINPTITHSTQETPFPNRKLTTVKYHQNRAIEAENNGWKLIQIFDWDKEDDIIELLHSKLGLNKRIYARKCKVKEISYSESTSFLDENHRQLGKANSSIQYGLFYEGELIQVMTFSKERFSRNRKENSYELLRLTSKRRHTVVGGASKLIKEFINSDYQPESIKTFADYSKGDGNSYLLIGMTYEGFANINALYSSIKTNEAYKVTEVTNKFRKEYAKLGQSQKEYMNNMDFYRINDAGNKIFRWNRK